MLTITGKALGRKKPLFDDWLLPLPSGLSGAVKLRDVIAQVVRAEVRAFKERQEQRRVFRALTSREIDAGVEKGKIEMGGSEVPLQPVDEETAVATALQAFEDGLYLVVIDDREQRSLESPIELRPESGITFVRLTLLAGG